MNKCFRCGSIDWDHANVGLIGAIVCTNCGKIYTMEEKHTMTESEFEQRFDNGDLDCDFAMFISERYDAWSKPKMLSYWEDPDAYQEFKDSLVTVTDVTQYSLGPDPLEKFPTIWSTNKP